MSWIFFTLTFFSNAQHFDVGSSILKENIKNEILDRCELLKSATKIYVEAYADKRGDRFYNFKLTQKRAQNTKNFIVTNCGISEDKIMIIPFGEEQATDNHDENRKIILNTSETRIYIQKEYVKSTCPPAPKQTSPKNVLSLTVTSVRNDLTVSQSNTQTVVELQRTSELGVLYQRFLNDFLVVGGNVTTKGSFGVTLGVGF